MAEIVEYRVEHTINELEQLERCGLLNKSEIKTIIKKRKAHEYRLQRPKKMKEDFLKYITYEESLLKLIRLRRDKMGIYSKKLDIDHSIVRRIVAMYRRICDKYQYDTNVWLSFVEFCKRSNMTSHVSALFSRMLQVHNKNEGLWIAAAKWEFEENLSPETARKLLQRALRIHTESPQLWCEYFRMELMYCDKLIKRKEIIQLRSDTDEKDDVLKNDELLKGEIANVVYKNAVEIFTDIDFAVKFLSICDEFSHSLTRIHKNTIYEDIKNRFPDCEDAYDLIARRFIADGKSEILMNKQLNREERNDLKKSHEKKAIELYEEMVQKYQSERMWTLYIRFNLELLGKTHKESNISYRLKKTLNIIERAWNTDLLSFDMFKEWILLLNSCSDDNESNKLLYHLLICAFKKWDRDINMWNFCLNVLIHVSQSNCEIKQHFERALRKCLSNDIEDDTPTEKIIDLWNLYIDWGRKKLLPSEVLNITERAAKLSSDMRRIKISEYFRPKYLEISNSIVGIDKAKLYYRAHKHDQSMPLDFFKTMIKIEKQNTQKDLHFIRSVHEDIVTKFGTNDATLWYDYIKFELKHDPSKVSMIYFRAIKTLVPIECDKIVSEYALIQSNPDFVESDDEMDQ